MHRLRALAVVGVIPWIPAAPPAQVVPSLAVPCRPAALHAELFLQGATGSAAGGVRLTNVGSRPCSLRGRPTVRFLDGSDPAGVKPAALPSRRPDVGAVYPSLRALRHGESAAVEIWWSNWCGSPSPTKLALELSTGTLVLPVDFSSRCDAPKISSTLSYGPLQPVAEQPNRASRLPLAAEIMEQLPGLKHVPGVRGRPGGTAVFHIVLTNTSGRPFRFGADCPTYVEGTGLDEPSQLHVLNCRPVALIGPRQSVVFEMRIRVPANATGSIALTWTLAPTTYEPPFVGGVILVER